MRLCDDTFEDTINNAKLINNNYNNEWDWIEEQLRTSTAQYVIVIGHYPVSY